MEQSPEISEGYSSAAVPHGPYTIAEGSTDEDIKARETFMVLYSEAERSQTQQDVNVPSAFFRWRDEKSSILDGIFFLKFIGSQIQGLSCTWDVLSDIYTFLLLLTNVVLFSVNGPQSTLDYVSLGLLLLDAFIFLGMDIVGKYVCALYRRRKGNVRKGAVSSQAGEQLIERTVRELLVNVVAVVDLTGFMNQLASGKNSTMGSLYLGALIMTIIDLIIIRTEVLILVRKISSVLQTIDEKVGVSDKIRRDLATRSCFPWCAFPRCYGIYLLGESILFLLLLALLGYRVHHDVLTNGANIISTPWGILAILCTPLFPLLNHFLFLFVHWHQIYLRHILGANIWFGTHADQLLGKYPNNEKLTRKCVQAKEDLQKNVYSLIRVARMPVWRSLDCYFTPLGPYVLLVGWLALTVAYFVGFFAFLPDMPGSLAVLILTLLCYCLVNSRPLLHAFMSFVTFKIFVVTTLVQTCRRLCCGKHSEDEALWILQERH